MSQPDEDLETDETGTKRKGKKRFLALLLAAGGGTAFWMKKKREQELDEALWEEPRSL